MAIINCNVVIPKYSGETVNIPLNLSFNPEKVFIGINPSNMDVIGWDYTRWLEIPREKRVSMVSSSGSGYYQMLNAEKFIINKKNASFNTTGDCAGTIIKRIAIG